MRKEKDEWLRIFESMQYNKVAPWERRIMGDNPLTWRRPMREDVFDLTITKTNGGQMTYEGLTDAQSQFLYDVLCLGHPIQHVKVRKLVKEGMPNADEPTQA